MRKGGSRLCPKCHGHFVRTRRRFADRVVSLFNPVERYACTNHLCRHEAVLWKSPSFAQRPVVAAAAFAGAALAGALVTGYSLYFASDEPTRAHVREAYTGMLHQDADNRLDATLTLPMSWHLPEPKDDTAAILEANAKSQQLIVDFLSDSPLAPAAHADTADAPQRE